MNLNHGIQKLFLIPTIVFVTISFLSIKNVYAEGSDGYKPDYTWAEELGRDLVKASEIHERIAGDLGQSIYQGFNHLPADIKPVIKDTIGYIPNKVGTVINTLFIDVPDIARTQDNTLRNLKGAKAFIDVANPFPTSTLEWAAQRDWDVIPPEPYIPTQQDIEKFRNFRPGIMEDVTVQEFRNNELISTQHYDTLSFDKRTEQLRLQEQDLRNSLDNAFYQEQYQSAQFRIHDPILDFQEPSIDLQSYKPLELSQSYIDNLRSLETKLMTDAHTSFSTQTTFDSVQAPDFSDYQDTLNKMEFQQSRYLESLESPRTTMDYIQSIQRGVEPIQAPTFDDYRDMLNKMEFQQLRYHLESSKAPRTTMDYIQSIQRGVEPIQAPTFDDYRDMLNKMEFQNLRGLSDLRNLESPTVIQGHYNPIGRSFNLPSKATVIHDHFFHNDIGRSFRQQQIYQPPSVDLGTIRISAPTIHTPRFEPIQMPTYEPIHIPQISMPVYQPPAIPNF